MKSLKDFLEHDEYCSSLRFPHLSSCDCRALKWEDNYPKPKPRRTRDYRYLAPDWVLDHLPKD